MILMIDNYCSFTYNIVQYFGELQQEMTVWRNDETTLDQIIKLAPRAIVLGPGPCSPNEAGVTLEILDKLSGKIPILGICLGHQAIGQAFGGQVVRAGEVMHGRLSPVYHTNQGVFADIPNSFNATRYHSLVIDKASLPDCLEVTAWTAHVDGRMQEIMGVRHKSLDVEGVQFHPESILSEYGYQLLNNFLKRCGLAKLKNSNLPKVA
ncbi:aminodeoxychorismate/anthranilate synthase component II [Moraxella catarrhalis]|uniref:anthranilate synthase component II n=1 Tax=Moraxella catarrhalis TaxID=480 RepID=UPI00128D1C5B|nr:aminodeoxychorismate/anthranilate synthase component II [Moraxella catarrhalis]MPW80729.1 anthranilate/aminodeoxychorismate synthase component II [Moraxella catarrhalis]MPX35928.1 anthranilate/aminodeoxychorismate synthase component II [Moraxella catarrhalis]MPX57467.1 aminodeoxychorismate/anthranilate synthase component II [Moraxella catarrhalis]